jgi:hypothetical protein
LHADSPSAVFHSLLPLCFPFALNL